jgi:hypothetical protein
MSVIIPDKIVDWFLSAFEDVRDKQFLIGDQLIEIVKVTGDKSGTLAYLAGKLGISASTLYDYYRIAKLWTPEYRAMYQALDWTIYRNADPNDPEDRELLDLCVDNGWNASKFREEKYPALKYPNTIIGKMIALGRRIYQQDTLEIEQREAILRAINILQSIMQELESVEFADEQV